jgi:hypothetical protein
VLHHLQVSTLQQEREEAERLGRDLEARSRKLLEDKAVRLEREGASWDVRAALYHLHAHAVMDPGVE